MLIERIAVMGLIPPGPWCAMSVTGNRRDSVDGAGWEVVHVAIDDHSRARYVQVLRDERKESVVDFLKAAVAHYKALGVNIKRLLTGNEAAYLCKPFAKTC